MNRFSKQIRPENSGVDLINLLSDFLKGYLNNFCSRIEIQGMQEYSDGKQQLIIFQKTSMFRMGDNQSYTEKTILMNY